MQLHRASIALTLATSLSACSAGPSSGHDAHPASHAAAITPPAVTVPPTVNNSPAAINPMAGFARMVPGEWRMTAESGMGQFDTWRWGPGQHSMRVMTDGLGAAGQPWRGVAAVYWHPGRREVRLLGLSPYARGVSEGTIRFEGEAGEAFFDLSQSMGHRHMSQRWTFDGPDSYHATLLEAIPPRQPDYLPLAEWDYFRTPPPNPPRPFAVEGVTEPSDLIKPLVFLLGTWESTVDDAKGGARHIRTTVEWIPVADAIYAQVSDPSAEGASSHLLDVYLYDHTGRHHTAASSESTTLRCLALAPDGAVYEGDITVLQNGGLLVAMTRFEGERVDPCTVRMEAEPDGTLRTRVWIGEGSDRSLCFDGILGPVQPAARGGGASEARTSSETSIP